MSDQVKQAVTACASDILKMVMEAMADPEGGIAIDQVEGLIMGHLQSHFASDEYMSVTAWKMILALQKERDELKAAALAEKPAERPADSEQERLAQMGDEQQYLFHVEGRAERPQLSAEQVRAAGDAATRIQDWMGKVILHEDTCKDLGIVLAFALSSVGLLTGEAEKVPPSMCPRCKANQCSHGRCTDWTCALACACDAPEPPAAPPVLQAEPLGTCDIGLDTPHKKQKDCENWRALADSPVSGEKEKT
jgi:hypothetical protein